MIYLTGTLKVTLKAYPVILYSLATTGVKTGRDISPPHPPAALITSLAHTHSFDHTLGPSMPD